MVEMLIDACEDGSVSKDEKAKLKAPNSGVAIPPLCMYASARRMSGRGREDARIGGGIAAEGGWTSQADWNTDLQPW